MGTGRARSGVRVEGTGESGELLPALRECANAANKQAAMRLLDLASFTFHDDPLKEIEQFGDRAPWRVRDAALAALSTIKSREVSDYLTRDVLMERAGSPPALRAAAARALGLLKNREARLAIYSAAADPSPVVREAAIESAVFVGDVRTSTLSRWLADGEPVIRVAALDAAALAVKRLDGADRDDMLASVRNRLVDTDPYVRDRCIQILAANPARESIPALIDAMAAEHDALQGGSGRRRLVSRCGEALAAVTGISLDANAPGDWREWWRTHEESYQLGQRPDGRARTQAEQNQYFTIPIRSDRVIFAVDISSSMEEVYGSIGGSYKKELFAVPPPNPKRYTKLDRVKNELVRAIRGLQDSDRFQIITFANGTTVAFDGLVPATREHRRTAEKFILQLKAGGETALQPALEIALGGTTDADTLFLLTDGEPTCGAIVDPAQILARVARANRIRRTEIHTIFVGAETAPGRGLLESLAREHRGEFHRVSEK